MTGIFNPDPILFEEVDELENDFLSPSKLQEISGYEDLNQVEDIKIEVNTKETTLGNFGKYLPSLCYLTLNNSFIPSIRDIGTSFSNVTMLFLSNCQLVDIDGIATIQNLTKLDISCNNVNDISPVSFLEYLQDLNASQNNVTSIEQIDYLSLLSELVNLDISSNPVCHIYAETNKGLFRDYVLSKLPNLRFLDGESCTSNSTAQLLQTSAVLSEVNNVENATDDPKVLSRGSTPSYGTPSPRNVSTPPKRPFSASSRKKSSFLSQSLDFSYEPSRPGSSGSNSGLGANDDSSILTFGSLFFGNPLHAIKDRKQAPRSPLIARLSQEPKMSKSIRSRPATAIGLRRSVKAISDDQLTLLKADLRKTKMTHNTSELSDSNNNFELKSPRPPTIKAASVVPAPPQATERPKTSQGFRSKRYKRHVQSRPSQSVDVPMTTNFTRRRGTLRSPIEDTLS